MWPVVVIVLNILHTVFCQPPGCKHKHVAGVFMQNLEVNDPGMGKVNRSYRLLVPPKIPHHGMPLLIGFHGQGGDPDGQASAHPTFDTLAKQNGWVLVYPAGMADNAAQDSGWNCGTGGDNSTCVQGTTDTSCHDSCIKLNQCGRCNWSTCYNDVAFIDQLLKSLESTLCMDPSRYFLEGESNGAMLVHHIVQELPGRFLGVACAYGTPLLGYLVGSKYQFITDKSLALRTSMLTYHGRQDLTIPWDGGEDSDGWLYETGVRTMGVWATLHDCDLTPVSIKTSLDGDNLACHQFHGCGSGGQVIYCLYDGGHGTWPDQPGGDKYIWSFFSSLKSTRPPLPVLWFV